MDSSQPRTSKLDMSLDDIIKLNRKQARGRGRTTRGAARGQRPILKNNRVRVIAKQNRVGIRATNSRGRAKIVMSGRNFKGMPVNRSKQPATAALAVLKRAKKTAAAAVRAARDAASILQRSRQQRQLAFDARRLSLPTSSTAFRDQRGRGMGRQQGPTRRHSFPMRRTRYYQAPAVNNQRVRPTQRRPNTDRRSNRNGAYQLQNVGSVGFRQRSGPLNAPLQQRFGRQNINISRASLRGRFNNRSRNDEYLAQARALIRAQNEQSRNGNFTVRGQTLPTSASRPPRRKWYFS